MRRFRNALASRFVITILAPLLWLVITMQAADALGLINPDYQQITLWLSVAYGISVLLALRYDDPVNP